MSNVWDHSTQKGSPLLLLLALADHAADDGFCWPGIPRLAQKIRMSERSVTRLLKSLEDDGDLHVIRQNGQHNWYVVRVGMTDEKVGDVLLNRGFETSENNPFLPTPVKLSPLTNETQTTDKTTDNLSGGTDIATPEPLTQLCQPNLHEPSTNRKEPEENQEPPAADPVDAFKARHSDNPFGLAQETEKARDEIEHPDFADPARDVDQWDTAFRTFCIAFLPGCDPGRMPKKKRRQMTREIQRLAQEVHASPQDAVGAIRDLASLEAWLVGPSATPFNARWAEGFQNTLIADERLLSARIASKAKTKDRGAHTPRRAKDAPAYVRS